MRPVPQHRFGFAAGTLVHAEEGLRAIEALSVGSLVLSQSTPAGSRACKRVVRTVKHENMPMCRARFFGVQGGEALAQEFLVTGDHPFYVTGYHNNGGFSDEYWNELDKPLGWRRTDKLQPHQLVQLANGAAMHVSFVERLWRTRTPGEAWVEANPDSTSGYRVRVSGGQGVGDPRVGVDADYAGVDDFNWRNESPELQRKWAFRADVYTLEVEEFHNYHVGTAGVWALDAAGAGVNAQPAGA